MNDPLPNLNPLAQPNCENPSWHETTQIPCDDSSLSQENILRFYGQSDRGKVRDNNEDQFLVDGERNLFIVADGMGGHAAGEVASRIAVECLHQLLTHQVIAAAASSSSLESELAQALRQTNAAVIKASKDHPEWSGMGSTAVIALLHDHTLYLANVGDSRAYLLRSGEMRLLSRDHSVAAVLAEQNYISHEEVRTHPLRNRLTACLGIEARIEPYTTHIPIQQGDRILLCSDGLWDMLTDQEIIHLWEGNSKAEEAVPALIAAANKAGGQDNITVVAFAVSSHIVFPPFVTNPVENSGASSLDDTVVVAY